MGQIDKYISVSWIHYLDIIYFLTKAVPVRVMATGQKRWLRAQGVDTYDSIEAVIEWQAAAETIRIAYPDELGRPGEDFRDVRPEDKVIGTKEGLNPTRNTEA